MTKLRWLFLLAPLLVGAGLDTTAHGSPDEAITVLVPAMSVLPAVERDAPDRPLQAKPALLDVAALDPAPPPPSHGSVDLHEVLWTVQHEESLDAIASRWGLKVGALRQLNPNLSGEPTLAVGTKLRVYRARPERPTRSIGSPNKGRLEHGLPMPEGPHWMLRERRTRAYGATNAVEAMVTAFTRYGQTFDDAPPVLVGELSARRGGRAAPHRSHRTGRDVDIGYILDAEIEGTRWKQANSDNFDVEKNWALIQALVDTGEVQQIFISSRLQRLLRPVARQQLDDEQFARYFRVPGADPSQAPILKHWDGHRDHMHVRFYCEDGNSRCRSRSSHGHS